MNILGVQISLLMFLQIVVTIALVFIYAFLISTREAAARQSSDAQTILLITFVEKNLRNLGLEDIVELDQESLAKSTDEDIANIRKRLSMFRDYSRLPRISDYSGPDLLLNILLVLIAPIVSVAAILSEAIDEHKYKIHRVTQTDMRKNLSAKFFLLFSGSLGYLLFALMVILPVPNEWLHIIAATLAALAATGILCSILGFLLLVWQQYSWKGYWQDKLFEVMATAAEKADHDLFNRSTLIRTEISSQPDIPIPGALAAYVVLFSIVQTLLIWISDRITWL
jgi:hypothetical protein